MLYFFDQVKMLRSFYVYITGVQKSKLVFFDRLDFQIVIKMLCFPDQECCISSTGLRHST